MGLLLGLTFALGVLLVWYSGSPSLRSTSFGPVRRWVVARSDLLREAGIEGVTSWQLLAVQCAAAPVVGLLVVVITSSLSVAACFAIFAFFAPITIVRTLHRRRRRELREVWPEVVDNLASAVRAGLSLPEAVAGLAVRGPEPLRAAFNRFAIDYRVTGKFSDCLSRLKDELADPVADRICESLRLAREVGGSELGRMMRTLSAFLREEGRTRAELETRQGWTVSAARLAVAAPWIVLLLLATQATTLAAYDSLSGRLLLAGGGAVSVVAYRIMLRIGRLPEEKRVLR